MPTARQAFLNMAIYYFLLAGVIIAGVPLCSPKCGRSGKIIYCCLAAVVFIFISAMRFQVGYDYNAYGSMYFNMRYMYPEDLIIRREEKGFLIPLYALNVGVEGYKAVFVYTSIVIYAATFYLIYRNSSCPWISVAAYLCFGLFFNSLCFLRQVMAALVILYGFKYIDKKIPWRYFVLALAAAAFHWSALIMLPMFFLLKIKPSYIYAGIVAAGTVIGCIFSKKLMLFAIDHLYMYKGYDPTTSVEAMNGLGPHYTIIYAVIFIISFVFRERLIKKNHANAVYINCMMYTTVFEAFGLRHAILSRFVLLTYMPALLYMLPDLVSVIKEFITEKLNSKGTNFVRGINICAVSLSAVFAVGCYTILMFTDESGVVPYVSQMNKPYEIFEEIVDNEEDSEEEEEQWISEDMEENREDYIDIPEIDGYDDVSDEYDDWNDEELSDEELEQMLMDELAGLS